MESSSSLTRPLVLFLAAFAVAVSALAFWTARSEALNYCVPNVIGGCDQNFATVQGALDEAESNPGRDNVWIATGIYSGNFVYNEQSTGNEVVIRGMGDSPDDTVLNMASTVGNKTGLGVNAPPNSLVTNLQLTIPGNADATGDVGISLSPGATADEVIVNGSTVANATGIRCSGCTITDSSVDLAASGDTSTFAVSGYAGDSLIENSELSAYYGLSQSDPGGTAFVERSRIEAHIGAWTDGGDLDLRDSLLRLDAANGAVGILLENYNTDMGNHTMEGEFDGLTIVNGPGTGNKGIRAAAADGNEGVDVHMTNSVISGFNFIENNRTLSLFAGDTRTVKFHSDYSAFDGGAVESATGGSGVLDYANDHHDDLENGVSYVDPGGGDYTPSLLGGLRDAGDPTAPAVGETDINGNPRACHGTDAGVIRRDIGAFEARVPGDDCVEPVTSIIAGPQSPTKNRTPSFTFATDKNPGTYLCSWDGDPSVVCAFNATAPDLGLGPHQLKVRTKDQYGNIDQSPETWNYEVIDDSQPTCETDPSLCPPPTCETDPSLCPKPDKTAPKVIAVKLAKKTKAKRIKVRFRSDEAGSTFKCKLNGAKWRTCKSPWTTPKLRKGKNVIRIQATDKAGNRSKVVKRVVRRR